MPARAIAFILTANNESEVKLTMFRKYFYKIFRICNDSKYLGILTNNSVNFVVFYIEFRPNREPYWWPCGAYAGAGSIGQPTGSRPVGRS
jgi:hypothetical protein